jgi:PPOX class probable F420-dependent enzyme
MPRMTEGEIVAFLDEPGHLVRIGTIDRDGYPSVVPTWFIQRDGLILFTPRGPAACLANLRRDPRIGLSIDEDALPYRKVTVRGTARIVHEPGEDDVWRDLYRSIAKRYIPADAADAYVNYTIDQPRALVAVPLADAGTSVTTWRMPVADEDGTGIWHRRYYLDGTHMAELADSGEGRAAYVPEP